MSSKKKIVTSAVALGTAAALTLGGTFAWQSISQRALNEKSNIVNPGGRLHSDITFTADAKTTNNDIYVENFADDEIFARIRLSEYMEIVMNYGNPDAEVVENVAGTKTPNGESSYTAENATRQNEFEYTYETHYFNKDNATDEYWNWTPGSTASDEVYYMPTFNLNKDSLVADRNGEYTVAVGGITKHEENYTGYTAYDANSTESGTEIYDADTNNIDEVGNDFDNLDEYVTDGNIKTIADAEHEAKLVGTSNGLIPLTEWLEKLENGEETGNYWVYDDSEDEDGNPTGNGWVYWSSPIEKHSATGLLLDSFTLKEVMDDTYYYAINVEGQFVTANDVGSEDSATGFYADGETVSENAEELLKAIGVQFGEESEDDEEDSATELRISETFSMNNIVSVKDTGKNEFILFKGASDEHPNGAETFKITIIKLTGEDAVLARGTDYTYDADTGLLTILLKDNDERLNNFGTELFVDINDDVNGGFQASLYIIWDDDEMLTLCADQNDSTIAKIGQAVQVKDADGQNMPSIVVKAYDETAYAMKEIEADGNYSYDADTGMLTITNAKYADGYVDVYDDSETLKATLYLTAGDGNSSNEGQEPDEPEEVNTLAVTLNDTVAYLKNSSDSSMTLAFTATLNDEALTEATNYTARFYTSAEASESVATSTALSYSDSAFTATFDGSTLCDALADGRNAVWMDLYNSDKGFASEKVQLTVCRYEDELTMQSGSYTTVPNTTASVYRGSVSFELGKTYLLAAPENANLLNGCNASEELFSISDVDELGNGENGFARANTLAIVEAESWTVTKTLSENYHTYQFTQTWIGGDDGESALKVEATIHVDFDRQVMTITVEGDGDHYVLNFNNYVIGLKTN